MPDIDKYQCDLLGSEASGEGNYLASKTTSTDTCSLNVQYLEVLSHIKTNLPNPLFSFDFVLGNIVETEVWEFEFIPITHRHTAVFLAGHLVFVPVCTYQYTSPAAAWMGMLETRSISPGWPRFGLWYVKPA